MTSVHKGFVDVPHGQVHFRYGGSGPVIVLLHDSPRSSVLHVSNLEWLGEHFTVIALDTPGYGVSSPLPAEQPVIPDFSAALAATLDALGIERCALYGFDTSSKIALQFAVDHPERAALTILDGLSLPAAAPGDDFLRRYLLPFEPAADGAHLAQQWTRILDFHRYFPWFERTAATRVPLTLPDDASLHEYATDVFMAGAHWTSAYGAALRYLAAPVIGSLRSRTVFMGREDDVLYGFLDSLPNPLPTGCRIERVPPDTGAWRMRLLQLLREADLPDTRWSPPPARWIGVTGGDHQRYVDLVHGQVRVRCRGVPGTGSTPALLINDVPGSSAGMDELARALSKDRATITPDLPGLGESTALPYPSLGTYVSALSETLEQLQLPAVDVVAHGLGTAFAIALAAHRPAQVRRLVLDAVPWIRSRDRGLAIRRYCPPIEPDRHGAYLQRIWHQLRDAEATWPWFDRRPSAARAQDPDLDPARLHAAFVGVMKQLPSYGDAARAALQAALRDILLGVKQPVVVVHDARDVRYGGTARVCKRLVDVRQVPRPGAAADRAELVRDFLS